MEYDGRILNPTEEEFNRWLSTQTMRGTIGGGRLSDLAQEQPMQPMNTIRNNATGRVIDMNYATKPLRDLTEADQQAAIEATGGRRTNYDVHIDGPREVARRQLPDGRTEVIREYPALQPTVDGRLNQTSKLVREIETPDYLNPAASKQIDFKLKQAQLEKAQKEAQGGGVKPEFKDGQWVFPPSADAPQGRAVPVEGYTPQKDIKQEAARKRVSGTLEKISGAYKELSDLGAMVDVDKPAEENIIKRTAASAPGQLLGTFAGTKEQSVRNRINQIRPLLIQEIRQATEMGARGLDSNKELEFYLQAATDPAKDIQSNLEALKVLDNAYGLGIMNGTDATPTAPARQPAAGGNTVTLPDGRKMRFPSGAAAEAFRRKAGL